MKEAAAIAGLAGGCGFWRLLRAASRTGTKLGQLIVGDGCRRLWNPPIGNGLPASNVRYWTAARAVNARHSNTNRLIVNWELKKRKCWAVTDIDSQFLPSAGARVRVCVSFIQLQHRASFPFRMGSIMAVA